VATGESLASTKLASKVIWITGASSGIGESLAHELARIGATLVLSARRDDALRNVQAACVRSDEHLVLPLDMQATDTFPTAVKTVLDRFGRIDVLFNGAGISQRGTALETQLLVDRQLMAVNYFGPVALTKLVLPSMIERRAGQIVVVSSLLGKFSVPGRAAYAGSKHALHGFFDALRSEVFPYGISVTIICPGFIQTNASRNALQGDGVPSGQMDEQIAAGMPSDECARQIVRAIARRSREAYIGNRETWAVLASRLAPRLFARFSRTTELK
jgi:short-subunit dehydrogenase